MQGKSTRRTSRQLAESVVFALAESVIGQPAARVATRGYVLADLCGRDLAQAPDRHFIRHDALVVPEERTAEHVGQNGA